MSDFKAGENFWWFYGGFHTIPFTRLSDIQLICSEIIDVGDDFITYHVNDYGLHIMIDKVDCYLTKRDALNALAARLKVLLDEGTPSLPSTQANGCRCIHEESYTCDFCLNA